MSLSLLGRVSLALLVVSVVFPIVGGFFVTTSPPRWLGIADVVVASAFFASTALVIARAQRELSDADRVSALRVNQAVAGIIPLLLVAYFTLGNRINWTVLIIGLAWRAWLLHYAMPSLIAALHSEE